MIKIDNLLKNIISEINNYNELNKLNFLKLPIIFCKPFYLFFKFFS
jgi:hypothetical protein